MGTSEVDGLDVEAVLEFAEYFVLNSRRQWEEFPLDLRRRMQKVLFPEGLVYDGEAFRTPVICLFFRDSAGAEAGRYKATEIEMKKVVARLVPTSNPLLAQLTAFEALRTAGETRSHSFAPTVRSRFRSRHTRCSVSRTFSWNGSHNP